MEYEKLNNYVKVDLFSTTIKNICLSDKQRKLLHDLAFEMQELDFQLKQIADVDKKVFLLPLLMLEGESSLLIEGTKTMLEDFAYDFEEINNIFQWETRNLINLYEKYLFDDYYHQNFILSADGISQIHLDLYVHDPNSKFRMTHDPSAQIKRVRPGQILHDDSAPNFISTTSKLQDASLVLLKPSLKKQYLEDLAQTIKTKIASDALLIDHLVLIHPIFEAIHPYVDGNGRLGRLFLSIMFKKLFPKFTCPIYLSEAFASDKETYIKRLAQVQKNNDDKAWNAWISYFIDCLIATKRKMSYRIKAIIDLYIDIAHSKALTTPIRKELVSIFFKYYKVNKNLTIKQIHAKHQNISLQTIYNDWKIVVHVLKIKSHQDGYFFFENLYQILRKKL